MALFRKKPVTVEACQWLGEPVAHLPAWCSTKVGAGDRTPDDRPTTLVIETLEGAMIAQRGDWIIKGVKGEIYPCKPDIFSLTYERVS